MKLITETSYDLQLVEAKSDKNIHIVGIFSSANIENNNKRKYKREILEREIQKVETKIEKGSLWGELGHPPNPEINMDKIAILTKMLEWKGDHIYGKAKVLDTPMGQIAKTLVKEGNLGISSRGLGTVSENGYVNEDFNLITWDLVTDPSNNPSWVNGIYEGKEFNVVTEESAYHKFLNAKLKKYGVKSPNELSKEQKKKFFSEVEKEWTGEKDTNEDIIMDGVINYLQSFIFKGKTKEQIKRIVESNKEGIYEFYLNRGL
jgi:hypothetical protein